MLEVEPDGRFTIWLSPFTVELRDRFTIAHELGHYFLHADAGKTALKIKREVSNRTEWEANWFAAGFLLPRAEFKRYWKKCGGSIARMSARFRVSDSVITTRRNILTEMGDEFS